MAVFYVFAAITTMFIAALAIKTRLKQPLCVICVSIAAAWLMLLALYKMGRFHDRVLLALLMGQSITGIFYFIKPRVPAALRIFTLPFLLSLTIVFYAVITAKFILPAFILLAVLWITGWLIFTYRHDPGKKELAQTIIECCEDK